MKILHIISCLDQGGAESTLYRLITNGNFSRSVVVSLTSEGIYGQKLRNAGTEVIALGMPRGRLTIVGIVCLYRLVRQHRPDVVQTWMYHADLIGGVIARIAGCNKVVWSIRHFNLDPARTSLSARWSARICAYLSRWVPSAIICCADEAARVHKAIGYVAEKFVVIPNGFEIARLFPDRALGLPLRRQWNVPDTTPLLGFVARWDPQKDHANLIEALAQVSMKGLDFRCVLVGSGMLYENSDLMSLIAQYKLEPNIILTGPTNDIPAVMNALDIHVLSSAGEAFPNVVAEAMACGVPCVVTDVGDARMIVDDTGWCVPSENSTALADAIIIAIHELMSGNWIDRSVRCRQHIVNNFSIEMMIEKYTFVWEKVSGKHENGRSKGNI